ncbi:hypothetical protein OEZ85_004711 [Tetradesmus obliquus]|uniref:Uncharacterized protein n=1 Tax=Tetradesmus obliquus TaxID=3088 RepID=A0ABY8UM27_TETOB|nr:hypothetical protein OEZ85_004711 [Tetradesmus obliquus]
MIHPRVPGCPTSRHPAPAAAAAAAAAGGQQNSQSRRPAAQPKPWASSTAKASQLPQALQTRPAGQQRQLVPGFVCRADGRVARSRAGQGCSSAGSSCSSRCATLNSTWWQGQQQASCGQPARPMQRKQQGELGRLQQQQQQQQQQQRAVLISTLLLHTAVHSMAVGSH